MKNRVEALDYLRGAMAISIMCYHYLSWSGTGLATGSVLSKLGIYAVSIFYILSGLSMGLVYQGRICNFHQAGKFYIKRIFRIAPLFWLVNTFALIAAYMSSLLIGSPYRIDIYKIVLNYTLTFGFIDPGAYITTGAWSIGNEMVFYAIFPILFLISPRNVWPIVLALVGGILVALAFAFAWLNPDGTLVDQWLVYINPFNQIFLFLGGIVLGIYTQPRPSIFRRLIAVTALFIFWLYPVSGDRIALVTGFGRLILSISCVVFVWGFYSSNIKLQVFPAKILSFFGEGCYSIYLLHPIVGTIIVFVATRLGIAVGIGFCMAVLVTLAGSWLTFRYIEKPMMKMGKEVTSRIWLKGDCPA